MIKLCLFVVVTVILSASDVALARVSRVNACVNAKNRAAARAFDCLIKGENRIVRGGDADLAACRAKLSGACQTAETRGSCPTPCEALEQRVVDAAERVLLALQPSPPVSDAEKSCVVAKNKAAARYASCVAKRLTKTLGEHEAPPATAEVCGLELTRAYANAEARGACLTTDDAGAVRALANPAATNLAGADLIARRFALEYLAGANLSATSLTRTILLGAELTDADLSGVTWDRTTCPDATQSDSNGSDPESCCEHLGGAVPAACGSAAARRIESFDSADGWVRSGNGSSVISVDTADKREGIGALVWRSTIDEVITKTFDAPQDLSAAAELRIWLHGNRSIGSACCGFSMRLLSGSGYFERHVLPDIDGDAWVEDVSERDNWASSATGAPSWADIRGLAFVFYGDSIATKIAFDDLRMVPVSSTAPTARRSAGQVLNDAGGPRPNAFPWSNPGDATIADATYASVVLQSIDDQAFVSSRDLHATSFGFAVPNGAVITGIRVEIRQHRDASGWVAWDGRVALLSGGSTVGTDHAYGDDFTSTDAYRYYGGPGDLWGASWTPAAINDPSFGVAFAAETHSPPQTVYVDDVRISIYYVP